MKGGRKEEEERKEGGRKRGNVGRRGEVRKEVSKE